MSHYLTAVACDHTSDDCDGPDECTGFGQWDFLIECDEDAEAVCRWECEVCSAYDGEWSQQGRINGVMTCYNDHVMTPCDCNLIQYISVGGHPLEDVMESPRAGRHEVVEEWCGGYTLHYKDA